MASKLNKILLLGDFMLNDFYYGNTKNIAKDAPIPVVNVEKKDSILGGTGFITRICKKFDLDIMPIGIVGNDNEGLWIKNQLLKFKIPSKGIVVEQSSGINLRRWLLQREGAHQNLHATH